MSLKIKISGKDTYTLLSLVGEIVAEDANKVSKKLNNLSKKKTVDCLVVNLNEVTHIDSYGLGIFVYFWKVFGDLKKKFIFLRPDGFMGELLENSRLTEVFSFIESEDDL